MTTIGVVGLGTMGLGIAQVYAAAGFQVIATDAHEPARANAAARMAEALEARVTAGKLSPEARAATLANLMIVETLAVCRDLVIEAIVEKLAAKQGLFATLEGTFAPALLRAGHQHIFNPGPRHRRRIAPPRAGSGAAFLQPADRDELVELAPHDGTLRKSINIAREISGKIRKNRRRMPRPSGVYRQPLRPTFDGEALALLAEGRSASDIDAAMLAAGYRLGPLSLIDLIGATSTLPRPKACGPPWATIRAIMLSALEAQVAKGHLGRKSGQGSSPRPARPGPRRCRGHRPAHRGHAHQRGALAALRRRHHGRGH